MEKLQYLLTARLAKLDTDFADLDPHSSDSEAAIELKINDTISVYCYYHKWHHMELAVSSWKFTRCSAPVEGGFGLSVILTIATARCTVFKILMDFNNISILSILQYMF